MITTNRKSSQTLSCLLMGGNSCPCRARYTWLSLSFRSHYSFAMSISRSFLFSIDVVKAQQEAKKAPHCPLEVRASDADNAMGAEYFEKNADKLKAELLKYGAIWFRGFDLMKSVKGYRKMYESLGLDPCLDPLHSSGLRKFASERDALYEEVRTTLPNLLCRRYCLSDVVMANIQLNSLIAAFVENLGQQAFHAWSLHWIAL